MKNDFNIHGEAAVIIVPYKGVPMEVLIDTADIPLVAEYNWYVLAKYNRYGELCSIYILGNKSLGNGKSEQKLLHRLITNAPKGKVVDHIFGNTLDNRSKNLRITTTTGNNQNRTVVRSSTGLRNVYRAKRKFTVYVVANGIRHYRGIYDTAFEANEVAKAARRELHTEMQGVPIPA